MENQKGSTQENHSMVLGITWALELLVEHGAENLFETLNLPKDFFQKCV